MTDKVVLITGGSSGIGRALAVAFARAGAAVAFTGRDATGLDVTRLLVEAAGPAHTGPRVLAVRADVSVPADCQRAVAETVALFGRLDVLVNNAGISMRALFEDVDPAVLRRLMDVNFFGTVETTKAALPHIVRARGSVVGVSSIAGYRGLPGRTGYSASKFAMHGFLEALRTELRPRGVHVLLACPGFTASNIRATALLADGRPQGASPREEEKMMPPEEVAAAIVDAVRRRRRDLVLTGQGRFTVFLNRWLPSLTDRLVFRHFVKEEGGFGGREK
ncbi:MAG: SDR family oxidoreductase [Hymenobacteraceae bacterium]|nr:SDR family oxidoreductase [Hymenobacteraceae bacterium]